MRPLITALLFVVASTVPAAAADGADGCRGQAQRLCIVSEDPPQETGNRGITMYRHPVGGHIPAAPIIVEASVVPASQAHGDAVGMCDDYERLIPFEQADNDVAGPLVVRVPRPSVNPWTTIENTTTQYVSVTTTLRD